MLLQICGGKDAGRLLPCIPLSDMRAVCTTKLWLIEDCYSGSTVIVVYPKGEVALDEDLVKNSIEQKCETQMKVGWRVGVKN